MKIAGVSDDLDANPRKLRANVHRVGEGPLVSTVER